MDNLQDYLKVKEAATYLGVSESTIRNWERQGRIGSTRHPVNGYRLFKRSDLVAMLGSLRSDEVRAAEESAHPYAEQPFSLPLQSLEIVNFRAFEQITIPQLGMINLIVGRNNVGKSSLLEAVRLYADEGHPATMAEILRNRDEARAGLSDRAEPISLVAVERLIHERHRLEVGGDEIRIGPVGDKDRSLSLYMERVGAEAENRNRTARLIYGDFSPEPRESLAIRTKDQLTYLRREFLNDPEFWRTLLRRNRLDEKAKAYAYVPAGGINLEELANWWDAITMTRGEQDVLAGLRLLEPGVERLQFIQRAHPTRSPVIGLRGSEGPTPLGVMGDGMNRILAILLALVNARGGILLVDEIENGIHYTAQPDLWRLILQVASRLHVQVFATTHSWDCIRAFQEAVAEVPGQQGYLIRLVRRDGQVNATVFDERKLTIATRDEIEVR